MEVPLVPLALRSASAFGRTMPRWSIVVDLAKDPVRQGSLARSTTVIHDFFWGGRTHVANRWRKDDGL
jgi:hypothetical protein